MSEFSSGSATDISAFLYSEQLQFDWDGDLICKSQTSNFANSLNTYVMISLHS